MRILFVGPKIDRRAQIKTFAANWSFYLPEALRAAGAQVERDGFFGSTEPLGRAVDWWHRADLRSFDHIISIGRFFSKMPQEIAQHAMRECRGIVGQIHDCPVDSPVSATFSICQPYGTFRTPAVYIGWAADPTLFAPEQPDRVLNILVDHPLYRVRADDTDAILSDVIAFKASRQWAPRFDAIRIRRILDGGFADIENKATPLPRFQSRHVSAEEMAAEFGAAHLFLPTHRESVGMGVVEAATAGCLPVLRYGYVKTELLDTVAAILYADRIPWQKVLGYIDPQRTRALALQNSWAAVAKRMVAYMSEFDVVNKKAVAR